MGLVPKRLPSSEMGGLGEPRQSTDMASMILIKPSHMSTVVWYSIDVSRNHSFAEDFNIWE
jgi:hypothetical protein